MKHKCPLCNSDGVESFIRFLCSNSHCENYKEGIELEESTKKDDSEWDYSTIPMHIGIPFFWGP